MGYWSDKTIELAEYGPDWLEIEKRYVCSKCLPEEGLSRFIESNAAKGSCSYCGTVTEVASMAEVVPYIHSSIDLEWGSAHEELPYDPEDGMWLFGEPTSCDELVQHTIEDHLEYELDDTLRNDIIRSLRDQLWAEKDYLRTDASEALANSWDAFCYMVKHERRFFFLNHTSVTMQMRFDDGEITLSPPQLLERLLSFLVEKGRVITKDAGWEVYRCQNKNPKDPQFDDKRMGPPPAEFATQPNRMSPAGISMFYGGATIDTCLFEIASEKGHFACGKFKTDRSVNLIDLATPITIPSLFDPAEQNDRPFWQLLSYFRHDFAKPIARDKTEHIEYVPTQIVSEFLRSSSIEPHGQLAGIIYESIKHPENEAIVLFINNSGVGAPDPEGENPVQLEMIDYSEVGFEPPI